MDEYNDSNLDSRGRRKSSPGASLVYSHKIHNISDPDGFLEEEINRIAKRLCSVKATGNTSRIITLREQISQKCMKFFYITGDNILAPKSGAEETICFGRTDEFFSDALCAALDRYDSSKGTFTHMLRTLYAFTRDEAARKAAKEDTDFGGGNRGALKSLELIGKQEERICQDYDEALFGTYEQTYEESQSEQCLVTDEAEWLNEPQGDDIDFDTTYEPVIDRSSEINNASSSKGCDYWLLQIIGLISGFLGKTSRAANDTRKLYTRMFFSETLTRMVKSSLFEDLSNFKRHERNLFNAVEIAFQDSYTLVPSRTVEELWGVDFVEKAGQFSETWTIPAILFIDYLESKGMPASNALVSQQRSHYEELLWSLQR